MILNNNDMFGQGLAPSVSCKGSMTTFCAQQGWAEEFGLRTKQTSIFPITRPHLKTWPTSPTRREDGDPIGHAQEPTDDTPLPAQLKYIFPDHAETVLALVSTALA